MMQTSIVENRVIPVACTTNLSSLSRYCSTPLHMFVGALEAPGMQIDTPWPIDMSHYEEVRSGSHRDVFCHANHLLGRL